MRKGTSDARRRPARSDHLTPARVQAVAARLFREKGFDATSTREIAEALGIQKASLYYYMRDKEELLYDICVASLDHTFAAAARADEEPLEPYERLQRFIRGHMLAMLADRDLNTTMLTNFRALTGPRRKDILRRRDEYDDLAEQLIAEAQASGAVTADVPAKYLTLALMNLLNWTMFWFRPQGQLSPEAIADLIARVFFRGVATPDGNGATAAVLPEAVRVSRLRAKVSPADKGRHRLPPPDDDDEANPHGAAPLPKPGGLR